MKDYDRLAEKYIDRRNDSRRFNYNNDIEIPALLKMIGDVRGKTILDMGCGFGDHAQRLARKGLKSLVGFDISPRMVELAQRKGIPRCRFYVGDMSKKLKHRDSSFDIVYSSLAIHYLKNINGLFKEVHRVLKRGGVFCYSTTHPIFHMVQDDAQHRIGWEKQGNRLKLYGDYFDESMRPHDLGHLGMVDVAHFTFETLIKAALSAGLEIIDYKDARPAPSSRKKSVKKYKLTTRLPTFILFKLKKK